MLSHGSRNAPSSSISSSERRRHDIRGLGPDHDGGASVALCRRRPASVLLGIAEAGAYRRATAHDQDNVEQLQTG